MAVLPALTWRRGKTFTFLGGQVTTEGLSPPPAETGLASVCMDDQFFVVCPYCGEQTAIYIEPDVRGSFIQDCEVCCNPWRVRISGKGDDRTVVITRADGSE